MSFASLRSRLALRFQLLAAVAAVLAVVGGMMVVVSTFKEVGEYREEIEDQLATVLDNVEREVLPQAVIGDYATIEQILRGIARRENIDSVGWRDARGGVLEAANPNSTVARPDWFAAWVGLRPEPAVRALHVGGASYGEVRVALTSVPLENRLWDSALLNLAMLAGMLALSFAAVAVVLRQGLAPLGRLADAAARLGAGDLSVRARELPGDAPEMRTALAAFDRMAGDIEALEQALREANDQLEAKVASRTAELSAANAALQEEKAAQQALITKLEEAHTQLLQSEKMAAIGQLAAGVAHEINNPIGFVSSNVGMLGQYVDDLLRLLTAYESVDNTIAEGTRQELERIKRDVELDYLRDDVGKLLAESMDGLQRVKRIVEDLKDFSHVDAAERQWANLERGLDSTLNVVWNELKYKAEVVREFAGIAEIECIPSQLNQVFMNLLVNAAQAIDGRGTITLRTGEAADEVWVEVEDTGQGIKPEHLARIFDPFFTTKPVGKGTGLGLSLSYGIVQKHGGRIEVTSEPGRGTTFRVVLPRQMPANGAS